MRYPTRAGSRRAIATGTRRTTGAELASTAPVPAAPTAAAPAVTANERARNNLARHISFRLGRADLGHGRVVRFRVGSNELGRTRVVWAVHLRDQRNRVRLSRRGALLASALSKVQQPAHRLKDQQRQEGVERDAQPAVSHPVQRHLCRPRQHLPTEYRCGGQQAEDHGKHREPAPCSSSSGGAAHQPEPQVGVEQHHDGEEGQAEHHDGHHVLHSRGGPARPWPPVAWLARYASGAAWPQARSSRSLRAPRSPR
jgi:hypothetical protein